MERGLTGTFETTSYPGPDGVEEEVRKFLPLPLPPDPPVQLTPAVQRLLERATLELGRLDGIVTTLPGPELFIYSYVRKEAVLSSQIEGTRSSLSDLLRHESEAAPGAPVDDVVETSRYVAAVLHATAEMASPSGLPLCNRLLRGTHRILMTGARGGEKNPGEFRRSQNWIGGTRPGNAEYVPPPHEKAAEAMTDLEAFFNDRTEEMPALVRAALTHVQFETIHPFLDGNGRIGRMLITLMLIDRGLLAVPALYLSLHFKQHHTRYYELLQSVRLTGDWEAWLEFFLEGVAEVAAGARLTAVRLQALATRDLGRLGSSAGRTQSMLRVLEFLTRRVVANAQQLADDTKLSAPTVRTALDRLCEMEIAAEITDRRRNRIYSYTEYLAILNEGT